MTDPEKGSPLCRKGRGRGEMRIKLRTKLIISYMLLIVLVFGLYTFFTFLSINTSSSSQLLQAAEHVLDQTKELLNYKFNNVMYASDRLFYDGEINARIKRNQNMPVGPDLMEDLLKMKSALSNAYQSNDMYRLTIYLNPSIYYANMYSVTGLSKTRFQSIESVYGEVWYKQLLGFTGRAMLVKSKSYNPETEEQLISSVRFMRDLNDISATLGIIRIDILQSDFDLIVANAVATDNGVAYLLNSGGEIMAASDSELARLFKLDVAEAQRIALSTETWQSVIVEKNEALAGAASIEDTDWILVSILPAGDLKVAGWQIFRATVPALAGAVLTAFFLSVLYSHGFTRRINGLSLRMMAIRNQTLPEYMDVTGSDEVSMLIKSYNYMIGRIQRFSEMQYKLGRDVKGAELKALQAQIDPHFLYNTLELINWVALRNNVPDISNIVQDLAKYYKLSLSKGKDVISIGDAVAHMETYINLQNFRFKNKLSLVVNIPEALYGYKILNLILQPLVENAIFHGIFETDSQIGTITLSAALTEDGLVLSVSDNGVGMSAETLALIFSDDEKEGHGYGIINVNNRLKLYYGNEYGLSCRSTEGEGTTVDIRIPADGEE